MISPDQSLLGRVFDSYQNMMQIAACIREAAKQLSVQQLRVLELSRRETGLRDYLPEALIERYATHERNQPTIISQLQNDNQRANNEIELLRKPFRVQLKAKLKSFLAR